MSYDFLFELGSEELPSGAVKPLSEALKANLMDGLAKATLQHGAVQVYATPRRLAILVENLQSEQATQRVVRRGPACALTSGQLDHPSPALLGFAKSCGVSVDQLTKLKTDKGEWWVYDALTQGQSTKALLPQIVNDAVARLPIAKPMRWGDGLVEFARPVHWVVMLYGQEVIEADVLGVKAGQVTFGHRFHHPDALQVTHPKAYASLLQQAKVVAGFDERRAMIVEKIKQLAEQHDLQAVMPEELLDEVTSIVEWPEALLAQFDSEFLTVPAQALIAAMQVHQKSFALKSASGHLAPCFVTIANIQSRQPDQVVLGNEKVMRARLSDAAFFYAQDRKQPLSQRLEGTERVVFQAKLGSLADKMRRMQVLMRHVIVPLALNETEALRAVELSKCDLLTGMVGEFPELQGVMGCDYALHDGETVAVAQALNEQYMPRFAQDELPTSALGLALSLVDRLDTLVGVFGIGLKPTGVKDPFKLRRHALAVVRLLSSTNALLSLSGLIEAACQAYGDRLPSQPELVETLKGFILDRLHSYYQTKGISSDLITAVRMVQEDVLVDTNARLQALVEFTKRPEASALAAASKRASNLLQQANALLLSSDDAEVDVSRFVEPAERHLSDAIAQAEATVADAYAQADYIAVLSQLASLKEPLDVFFDQVMVLVPDEALKRNRLNLLRRLNQLLQGVADISCLSVEASSRHVVRDCSE